MGSAIEETKFYISCVTCGRVCRVMRAKTHDIVKESLFYTCNKCGDVDPNLYIRTGYCIECNKQLSIYNESNKCHICRTDPIEQNKRSVARNFICWVCGEITQNFSKRNKRICDNCGK